MKAVILAAGRSKRMKPIQDKNFIKFLGKPLIEYQIASIKNAGFEDIILIGGAHNLEALKGLGLTVIEQENLDEGMAGAMMSLESHLQEGEEILLLSANDYLEQEAYELMKKASESSSADLLMLAKKVDSYFPGGYIAVDGSRITEIVEKPGEGNEPSDMINIVLHVHKKPLEFIRKIRKSVTENDDWYEMGISKLIEEGAHVEAVPYEGFWQAIKYPWHVLALQKHFFKQIKEPQISDSAEIADSAVIKGPVIIEEGAKVFDHATVSGPAYIGRGVVIANNALVRESEIGEGSMVGYSSEVARSNLAENVWLHMNYVGDSILCSDVMMGAGAVTGNFRLDGEDVKVEVQGNKISSGIDKFGAVIGSRTKIGINVSMMPGTKIGSGTFVAGGIIIDREIPDGSFVKGKNELDIRNNKKT